MTDLTSLTLAQARDALRKREFTATELAEAHLAAIEKARALNAFVWEASDRARDMARLADARLAREEGGPLAGLPLGVKDVFCTAGVRTTACSHILDN
jgi:aspartyl-tRNA(Asn)/glutamyl-tRNA(Gln) amidotransferase subunit A